MFGAFETREQRYGYAAALSLTLLRLALAVPLLFLAAHNGNGTGTVIAALVCVGFVSDVYDGVIARHFGVATAGLRRFDSATDTVFYIAAAVCAWRLHQDAIIANRWLIVAVGGTLVLNHIVELIKFGREGSYHAWTAKAWGVALFVSLVVLFAGNNAAMIPIALSIGLLSHLENLVITFVLPAWDHDIPSVVHALRIRRGTRASG